MPPLNATLPEHVHGLHYSKPAEVWEEAFPLGNGIMGAMIWGNGRPLKISLDRTDIWDLRGTPEFQSPEFSFDLMRWWHEAGRIDDLLRVYEKPCERHAPCKLPGGRIEIGFSDAEFQSATLDLTEAAAKFAFGDEKEARIFVHAVERVGMICLASSSQGDVRLISPFGVNSDISQAEKDEFGYPPPTELSGEDYRAYVQQEPNGFQFAAYVRWDDKLQLAWSMSTTFEGADPLEIAKTRVEKALCDGFDEMFASHQAWWRDYWNKSSVSLPDKSLERQWYLDIYKFGAMSRRGCPPAALQGPWTIDGKLPCWKGDYHHDMNTQFTYSPQYASNHLEEGLCFLDWLWETRGNCVDYTKRFYNLPGLNVPGAADLNNNALAGWRQYSFTATAAAWLSHHFYLHWAYSRDMKFLRDRAYPYLHDAAVFIERITSVKNADGKRTLPLSCSPEIEDNKPEAWFSTITNYELALIRWLLGAASELARELGINDEADHWFEVLAEMPDYEYGEDGRLLIAKDYPLPYSHRHHSHLLPIFPLNVICWDQGEAARRTIRASIAELMRSGTQGWCGYSFPWFANLSALARDGEDAAEALGVFTEAFTLRNSLHCNGDQSGKGYSNWTYKPITLEGNCLFATAIQNMLMQSSGGVIRIFPAIPDSWQDVSFTGLRAEGAFLVSALRSDGITLRVEIVSEAGGLCRLISPFSGNELAIGVPKGQRAIIMGDSSVRYE